MFEDKRPCLLLETLWCFMSNVLVFIFLFFEGSKIADGGPYIDFLLNEIVH
jgi:hypothetical protein